MTTRLTETMTATGGSSFKPLLSQVILFVGGFIAILSFPLIPGAAQTPRLLDILGLAAFPVGAWSLFRLKIATSHWLIGWGVALAFVAPLTLAALTDDVGRVIVLIRAGSSIAAGIMLAKWALRTGHVATLAVGIWSGAAVAMLIAAGQIMGKTWLIGLMPVDRADTTVLGFDRVSVIWGHPNAAAQITMAAAAVILLVSRKSGGQVMLPLALYLSIAGLNYALMMNRAPIVIGLVIAILMTIRHRSIYLRLFTLMCLIFLGAILISDPGILLGERWTGTFSGMSTEDQAQERMHSTLTGITIAFEQPLGYSAAERETRMLAETGVRASHNGYVFAMQVIGAWSATFLFFVLFLLLRPFSAIPHTRHVGAASGSICLMLLFEDALLDPSIVFILTLISTIAFLEYRGVTRHT